LLKAHNVSPEQLVIEVVETCTFWREPAILYTLSRLRNIGVEIAIDDFPCWEESEGLIDWLRTEPVGIKTLKFDRSLVREVCDNKESAEPREFMRYLAFAHERDMRVIAEGVEDEHDAITMELCGVDALQGFGIGKPKPAHLAFHSNCMNEPLRFSMETREKRERIAPSS